MMVPITATIHERPIVIVPFPRVRLSVAALTVLLPVAPVALGPVVDPSPTPLGANTGDTFPLAVVKKLFQAAMVADGYTYVLSVVPEPA